MPDQITSEDLFARAAELNGSFKSAVADVQGQVWTEEWQVADYGDMPTDCGADDTFRFSMSRHLPAVSGEGWRFPADPAVMRDELAQWMEANGYRDVTGLSYTGDVDTLTLTARNVDAGIAEITVQYHPGEVQDGIDVSAKSVCADGDVDDLAEVIFPGIYEDAFLEWTYPETERPDDTPIFGFTEDGQPR
ncbi:hypothetical protein ACH0AH_10475 [Microbacterium paludicola]|uniref:hypothetical protein n=1 Tax=Microbacterium paludicola TaxID=300019 RepID=UPI00387A195D